MEAWGVGEEGGKVEHRKDNRVLQEEQNRQDGV